jgi:hypothetical protein
MSIPTTPFVILPVMFAIKRDGEPHMIIYPENGSHALKSPQSLDAWATIYARQSDAVRDAAITGSMFGWDVPGALPALIAMTEASAERCIEMVTL